MDSGRVTLHSVAAVVAGHHERITHVERSVADCPVKQHGESIAAQVATLTVLADRLGNVEQALKSLRNWQVGVLTTSVGTLVLLLWQTVGK